MSDGDLIIKEGRTFIRNFIYKDANNVPVDISGYKARFQTKNSEGKLPKFDASTDNGKAVVDGINGKVTVTLASTETKNLKWDSTEYEVIIVSPSPDFEVISLVDAMLTAERGIADVPDTWLE